MNAIPMQGVITVEMIPVGSDEQAQILEDRLVRLEKTAERMERLINRFEELAGEKDPEIQAWREGVSAWIQAEHEQVELHATMLLGLAGLTAVAQRSTLPEPPVWPTRVE